MTFDLGTPYTERYRYYLRTADAGRSRCAAVSLCGVKHTDTVDTWTMSHNTGHNISIYLEQQDEVAKLRF